MYILFPGRHHLLTQFQFDYLNSIISKPLADTRDLNGAPAHLTEKIDAVVFAVTSSNHSNTRRNPLPFYIRALALEEFGKQLSVPGFIYGIDDIGNVKEFASYTIKRIKHDSEGQFDLNPDNTLVICSTPVLEMYERSGFRILPAELADRKVWSHHTQLPWDLVEKISSTDSWENDPFLRSLIHSSSYDVWKKYRLGPKIQVLFRDKMISDDGDITTTRDYNTYVRQMDEIAGLKFRETAPHVRAGRIGDIGCAVGSWIKLACEDERFRESDFYGIEVARHLFDLCQQRKHNGEFKNPFVFFSQRNAVTGLVFDRNSMNTIHTSSLTHEIESYGSRNDLLSFIKNRFDELASGGVWVNRDVVGPENKEQLILMKLNDTDGRNDDFDKKFKTREDLATYLRGLSTLGRFKRFAQDFRKKEGYNFTYETVTENGTNYFKLRLRDACEFMSRKDYVDNWESEMHETFCFWDFEEWKTNLQAAGFTIASNSSAYTNDWIVTNRLIGKVELLNAAGSLEKIPYPVTNMIMIAAKE
ncbi:MAG: transferase [Cyclobacteriaceae bacterium]|nr:transferase [Cyclobacteriaceae bacterium]